MSNAFNCVSRQALLEECAVHFPELLPWVGWCYGSQPTLWHPLGQLSSEVGVQQGDPLGPLLFSLVLHKVVSYIAQDRECLPLLFNGWYLDDGVLLGHSQAVNRALTLIQKMGPSLGLFVNVSKCELFGCGDLSSFPPEMKVSRVPNLVILGAPIGDLIFCAKFVAQKRADAAVLLSQLAEVGAEDPQVAFLLLRQCAAFCKLVHLARSAPPSHIAEGLALFDKDVRQCFAECTAVDAADVEWMQAQLSLSRGGLGLRSLSSHCVAAYLASISSSGCDKWNLLVEPIELFNGARLLSISSRHAASWLTVVPSPGLNLHLEPNEFQIAVKWWLGMDVSFGSCYPHCPDHRLDPLGHHALTCKHGGDVVLRHNSLRDVFVEFCHRACLGGQVEVGSGQGHDRLNSRPADVLVKNWHLGKPAAFDLTITSPLNPTTLTEAGVKCGSSAQVAEVRKHAANDGKCKELGWVCIPLAVESYGCWGMEAQESFKRLAARLAIQMGCSRSQATTTLYQRLSLSLGSLSIADRARLLSASSPHASSWLTVTPSEGQGLHLDPPVFQTALKWWLGLDTAEGSICALCPDKMLDPLGHHATTCKRGGDVVFRHNKLRDILAETCRRAHLSVQVEAGCNLTPDHSHSRPADVLISNWVLGKTAACDLSVTSPLNSNIMSEAGVTAGAAAQATELRKHEANDVKCSELGWLCIPLVVESYGAWGKEAMESFSSLASRLAITSSRPKSAVLSELYGRLNLNLVRANAQLGLSYGGLGLRSISHHSCAAYIASLSFSGLGSADNPHLMRSIVKYNGLVSPPDGISVESILASPIPQRILSQRLDDHSFGLVIAAATDADKARLLSTSAPHAASWLSVVPSIGLGLHLDPNELQIAVKWWLGLDTSRGSSCGLCPDVALDPLGHHAATCRHGGDVVIRHNRLRDVVLSFCHQAHIAARLEAGSGLTPGLDRARPADVLVRDWAQGKPAAFDITVTSPLTPAILAEASRRVGAAAEAAENRKHTANDPKCAELGWRCVPLAVETYCNWGEEARGTFALLATRLAFGSSSFRKARVISDMFGRLNITLVRAIARAILARTVIPSDFS
eukprot:Em0003g1605a